MLWNSREPTITNLYLFNKPITGRNTCCCLLTLEAHVYLVRSRIQETFFFEQSHLLLRYYTLSIGLYPMQWLIDFRLWADGISPMQTIGNHSTSMLSALICRNRCMWRRWLLCKIGNYSWAANLSILTSFWVYNNHTNIWRVSNCVGLRYFSSMEW